MGDTCRVCSETSVLKCSLCKVASYCSKDHQKQDWKTHRETCLPFQVKSSPDLGRFLEASRPLLLGSPILSESPVIAGPRDERVCLGCYSPDPLTNCPQCGWPACNENCPGLQDMSHHGAECMLLRLHTRRVQFLSQDFFRYEAILPLRCLLLQCRNPKKWKVLQGMEAHMKKRGPHTEIYKQVQENVVDYLTKNFFSILDQMDSGNKVVEDRSAATIQRVVAVLDVNALEIRLSAGQTINALYPTAYLLEHNCLPNTRHGIDSNTLRLTVRANQPIAQGSHISTMYTHALWGTQQRQDHLRSTKYFTCRCRRCGDPSELGTYLSALKCLAPGSDRKICGGAQLPVSPLDPAAGWRCENCPTSLTTDQVVDLMSLISAEVDQVQEKNPTVESLTALLDKLRKLLHKNHYQCFHVAHSLVQLIGRQPGHFVHQLSDTHLQNKLKLCQDLLAVTSALDPTSSRLTLYSAVLQVEIYTTTLALVRRDSWDKQVALGVLKEAKKELESAKIALEPEEPGPGKKLAEVVDNSLDELAAFCSLNKISLEANNGNPSIARAASS